MPAASGLNVSEHGQGSASSTPLNSRLREVQALLGFPSDPLADSPSGVGRDRQGASGHKRLQEALA